MSPEKTTPVVAEIPPKPVAPWFHAGGVLAIVFGIVLFVNNGSQSLAWNFAVGFEILGILLFVVQSFLNYVRRRFDRLEYILQNQDTERTTQK